MTVRVGVVLLGNLFQDLEIVLPGGCEFGEESGDVLLGRDVLGELVESDQGFE